MQVFVPGWEHWCCGTPFRVGSVMAFPVKGPPSEGWRSLFGGRCVGLAAETHHVDEEDDPAGVRLVSGRVARIQLVHAASELDRREEQGEIWRLVPGSALLSEVTRTRRVPDDLEAGGQVLQWEGYLVDLDESVTAAGKRYGNWSPELRRELTPEEAGEPAPGDCGPHRFAREEPPACPRCGAAGKDSVSPIFATLVPEPGNRPRRKEHQYHCGACRHQWTVLVALQPDEFGVELRAVQDEWRTQDAHTPGLWFTTLELENIRVTNDEVAYVLRDPVDGLRYGWRWQHATIDESGAQVGAFNLAGIALFLASDLSCTVPAEPDENGVRWWGRISIAEAAAARESELRRVARKQGYRVEKSRSVNRESEEYGRYRIADRRSGRVLAGGVPYRFSMTLDEVEGWIFSEPPTGPPAGG